MRKSKFWLSAVVALGVATTASWAGPDDDAPFKGDGKTRNAVDPIYFGQKLADFPMNAEPESGLRILPPTRSNLFAGQRFDLRLETQIPAKVAPKLVSLTINGSNVTQTFEKTIQKQGKGTESGTPSSELLFGETARNLSFDLPGKYVVEAVLDVDGAKRSIRNVYEVVAAPNPKAKEATNKLVFFLGDGMGTPMRTAARLISKPILEGRSEALAMEQMSVQGMIRTTSFDSIITDSGPGMASLVSGVKQSNNAIQVSVDNTPEDALDNPRIETIFEYLKRVHGWKIGVVTDAFLVDATPASAQAHNRARSNYVNIAQQMIGYYDDSTALKKTGNSALASLSQPLDVLLGGGAVHWMKQTNPMLKDFYQYPSGGRKDVDLLVDVAPKLGYNVVHNLSELKQVSDNQKLIGIFTGEFRKTSSGLGADNLPGTLDRLVARGQATIRGKDRKAPEIGLNVAPPFGTACGETVADCFNNVPMKQEMVDKAISVLESLVKQNPRDDGGWILLVEQSQSDKLGHILEYERAVYEVVELDLVVKNTVEKFSKDNRALAVVTADHAQPQTIIGVAMTSGLIEAAGNCFQTTNGSYPVTLGAQGDENRPCALQDAIGTFNDATFPTYADLNGDGFPDDPDPAIKIIIEDGGRPAYSTTYLTNYQPLKPSASKPAAEGSRALGLAALPNPARQPEGLFMSGNMPSRNVKGGANKTSGAVDVAPHSGDDVLVSAEGAGAHHFSGYYENTEILPRLARALGGPAVKASVVNPSGKIVGW